MRRLVHLWDLCKAGDVAGLGRTIVWSGSGATAQLHYWGRPVTNSQSEASCSVKKVLLASSSYHAERFEMFSRNDLIGPALFQLGREVSEKLAPLAPVVTWQREESRLRRRLVVPDLKTALWLQFAEAIDGNKEFRSCEGCGRWFELSPKLARTSRIFCSGKCRVRRYRLRRENARQLFSEGRTVKKIAEEMGTDVGTVKGWLKEE